MMIWSSAAQIRQLCKSGDDDNLAVGMKVKRWAMKIMWGKEEVVMAKWATKGENAAACRRAMERL